MKLKERTKRFYNNVNSKAVKSIEELVKAIALNKHTKEVTNWLKCQNMYLLFRHSFFAGLESKPLVLLVFYFT